MTMIFDSRNININPSRELSIEIANNGCRFDENLGVAISGLAPNEKIVIQATLSDLPNPNGETKTWISKTEFIADASGTVSLARDIPSNFTLNPEYRELDPMGIIGTMKPVDGSESYFNIYPTPSSFTGSISVIKSDSNIISRNFNITMGNPLSGRIALDNFNKSNFVADFFPSAGTGKTTGVIVVGGSGGGLSNDTAAQLAAWGFPSLSVAYFQGHFSNWDRLAGLPEYLESIDLKYFELAIEALRAQDGVNQDSIVILGTSRGGELALELATHYSAIKGVVAVVPSDMRIQTVDVKPNPSPAWRISKKVPGFVSSLKTQYSDDEYRNASIAIEKINGPILMVGADDDGIWPSAFACERAKRRLPSIEVIENQDCGHLIKLPNLPLSTNRAVYSSGLVLEFGGTLQGNQRASKRTWQGIRQFLESL